MLFWFVANVQCSSLLLHRLVQYPLDLVCVYWNILSCYFLVISFLNTSYFACSTDESNLKGCSVFLFLTVTILLETRLLKETQCSYLFEKSVKICFTCMPACLFSDLKSSKRKISKYCLVKRKVMLGQVHVGTCLGK